MQIIRRFRIEGLLIPAYGGSMRKYLIAAVFCNGIFVISQANAQETLSVQTIDNFGGASLATDAFGCLDASSAMRLDLDSLSADISSETRRAFEVGVCFVLPSGLGLANVDRVAIGDQRFIRSNAPDLDPRIYSPEWSVSITNAATNYDAAKMNSMGELSAIAADLAEKVTALEHCTKDGDELEKRITEYNERLQEAEKDRDAPKTGSRLQGGGDAGSMTSFSLPRGRSTPLYREGAKLADDLDAFNERCGKFNEGFALDRDYMTVYRAVL